MWAEAGALGLGKCRPLRSKVCGPGHGASHGVHGRVGGGESKAVVPLQSWRARACPAVKTLAPRKQPLMRMACVLAAGLCDPGSRGQTRARSDMMAPVW